MLYYINIKIIHLERVI